MGRFTTVKNMRLDVTQTVQLERALSHKLEGELYVDEYRRGLFATDASIYQIMPAAVLLPKCVEDVVLAINACRELQLPITARGSGTSLSGQSIGPGLVVDFSKYMDRIVRLDPESSTATVQPGVVLDQLNAAAAVHGLQFGPDVATNNRANIGGMIGNNSAGARSILHGKTVDHVIKLDVVLADGTHATLAPLTPDELSRQQIAAGPMGSICAEVERLVRENRDEVLARFPRIVRRVAGYNLDEFVPEFRATAPCPPMAGIVRTRDAKRFPGADFNLAKLIVGAEGTLGCVTSAEVHLVPKPAARGLVVLQFDSLRAAISTIHEILAAQPSAAELFDGMILRLAENSLEYRNYLDFVVGHPDSLMLVEFSGQSIEEVKAQAADLQRRISGHPGLTHVLPAMERQLCDHIWACRKAALPLLMGIPGARKPIAFVEDTAIDPLRLPEFVSRFHEIITRAGTEGAFYGHASVGCLHIRPLIDTANKDDLQKLRFISEQVCELVMDFTGSMTGEHGDGLARSYLIERQFGPKLYRAFQELKAAFDPDGLMNPGKIVDGPSPTENLRYGEDYQRPDLQTGLDFSREGGLLRAAELCNGAGVCRKLKTGTMCPSFMATRDEEHSTRGRSNALRLVLSGEFPVQGLSSDQLYRTYDLCLQCKGCKAECPSNVDVAKLKVEFLYQYYQHHRMPWGARAMGHVARLNRLGAATAPASNWLTRLPGIPLLQEWLFGVDRRRPLPTFTRSHFLKWFHGRTAHRATEQRGEVVLLDDCLTSYCEPSVNRSAVEILEAAGFTVCPAGLYCCGRALLSKGLVSEARSIAKENIRRLRPWLEKGTPIVGCEPSCLLMLADDYQDLVPGKDSERLAESAHLVDSFVNRNVKFQPLKNSLNDQRIILHGHCHQKALVGTDDTCQLLERTLDVPVTVLDSGCCGMAGSFGYEHYELSMAIGDRVLFPAVKENPEAAIVAPGFSCRHQILHGTGRRALHPIELLQNRIEGCNRD